MGIILAIPNDLKMHSLNIFLPRMNLTPRLFLKIKVVSLAVLAGMLPLAVSAENVTKESKTPRSGTFEAGSKTRLIRPESLLSKELSARIDSYVDNACRTESAVGYAIAVVDHGRVVYERCFGEASPGLPIAPNTIFGLASITKTFTALCLLSLVDKGLIDLDASISNYLPDAPTSWNSISVRQLASMTAGFARDLQPEMMWQDGGYEKTKSMQLLSAPGSKFLYSNIGYRVLGQIIENVSHMPLLQLNRELILGPSKMTSTGILPELRDSGRLATPFNTNRQGEIVAVNYRNPGINFASGNFFSTLEDMSKYASALLKSDYVSKTAYKILWYERPTLTSGEPDYWAFGWGARAIVDKAPVRKVSMNGGLPGVASTITLYPDSQLGIVSLSNFRTRGIAKIAQTVGQMLMPEDVIQQESGSSESISEERDSKN